MSPEQQTQSMRESEQAVYTLLQDQLDQLKTVHKRMVQRVRQQPNLRQFYEDNGVHFTNEELEVQS